MPVGAIAMSQQQASDELVSNALKFTKGELGAMILRQQSEVGTVFIKITNREDALQIVRDASTVHFTLAAFQLVVAFTGKFDTFSLLILADVVINVIAGAVLRNLNSRAAAIVLLLNLLVAFIIGDGPLFHALLLWPSVRAVEATWRMHSPMPERIAENPGGYLS